MTKGYRLYDMATQKIMHSRDVVFNERVKDCWEDSADHKADDYKLIKNSQVTKRNNLLSLRQRKSRQEQMKP